MTAQRRAAFLFLFVAACILLAGRAGAVSPAPDTDLTRADTALSGEAAGDSAGTAVSGVGDVNGDGLDDFVVGAPGNDETGSNAGQIYLFLGKSDGWDSALNLSQADASFLGEGVQDTAGISVAGVGDANGDGLGDFIIGAPYDDEGGSNAGQIYLILGKSSGWAMNTSLALADASFHGENAEDQAGYRVAGAGDVNGDDLGDFLISVPRSLFAGEQFCQAYLILGKNSGWASDVSLSQADASFIGENPFNKRVSCAVAGAGDVNGDGFDDIMVGEHLRNNTYPNSGEAYIIFGKSSGWALYTPLTASDASYHGEGLGNWAGYAVAGAGDVNGDGYDDILIGAPGDDDRGRQSGEAYLVLGKASGWSLNVQLDQAEASFITEWYQTWTGSEMTGVGDVNQDGLADFMIAAVNDDETGLDAGQVFLLLGRTSGWAQNMNLVTAEASFWGLEGGDNAGTSISYLGDVNGDGLGDILIGAPLNDSGGEDAGQAYLLLGSDGPTAGDFSPDRPFEGTGSSYTFSSAYYDLVDGVGDLRFVMLTAAGNGVTVDARYRPGTNRLWLRQDGGNWVGPCTLGQPGTLAVTDFELDCQATTATVEGASKLRVDWRLRLLQPVTAAYSLEFSLKVMDNAKQIGELSPAGTWLVDPNGHDHDLSLADGDFLGEGEWDIGGWAVVDGGDLNGDGLRDLVVGAPNNGENEHNGGQVYIFFGSPGGWSAGISLGDADASYIAEGRDDYAGFSLAGAGDLNNDGYDDLVIGAYSSGVMGITAGQVYVILGKASGWALDTSLSLADASYLPNDGSDYLGYAVDMAGDVNGDGFDDFLMGAWGDELGGGADAGTAYLVLGKASGWAMDVSVDAVDASFLGETKDQWASFSLAGGGDVNNDGYDDILVGAPLNHDHGTMAGKAYLILGKASGWALNTPLALADATFLGDDEGDLAGMAVAPGGDLNNDGFDDFFISAIGDSDGGGREAGQAFLFLGTASGWAANTLLSQADASYVGERAGDRAGTSITPLPDVNNDGYPDFAIGAPENDDGGTAAGKAYVVLGQASGWSLGNSLSGAYLAYWGEGIDDRAGYAVAGVADAVGSGSVSLLIGAPGVEGAGIFDVGKAYHVLLQSAP